MCTSSSFTPGTSANACRTAFTHCPQLIPATSSFNCFIRPPVGPTGSYIPPPPISTADRADRGQTPIGRLPACPKLLRGKPRLRQRGHDLGANGRGHHVALAGTAQCLDEPAAELGMREALLTREQVVPNLDHTLVIQFLIEVIPELADRTQAVDLANLVRH